PLKRKMRKGTHSCSECKRREVKCIFIAGQERCKECHFRGSNCVKQCPGTANMSAKRTKSMQERISELEALIQTLRAERGTDSSANQSQIYVDDIECLILVAADNSPEANLPPLMRLFDNDVVRIQKKSYHFIAPVNDQVIDDTNSHSGGPSTPSSLVETTENGSCSEGTPRSAESKARTNPKTSKDQRTREKLLECMYFGDRLDDLLQKNEQRWITWRTRILAHPPNESFTNWSKRVIHYGSPSDLGALILLIGTGSDRKNSQSLIPPVATLITSDDGYATTLSGIECSLLLSDYYCSIGQPRRAWLAIQRGLACARLTGIHRRSSSLMASGIMLLLHYENQFLSLMLGTPRGIDFHCNIEYAKEDVRFFKSALGAVCSKFLIGTQDQREPSLSLVLELNQQLQALALAIPKVWKQSQLKHSKPAELLLPDVDQDKVLIQIHIQQLRTYLYLPLMLGSGATQNLPTSMYEVSRIACLESSRELLGLYQFLHQQSLFENTLLDFMGFSAAMLIILNLLGCPKFRMEDECSIRTSNQDEQDWDFVETTVTILDDRAKSHDSKVIRQSLEVLRALSGARDPAYLVYPGCKYRLVVPFFGDILAQPG
ncbi:hypothetical protein COCMIDRAFT_69498, partial [Bipolaris oryzae ATCC 44560]